MVAAALAFLFRAQQPLPFWLFIGMAGLGMIATLFAARSRRQAIVERHKYAETQRAALETQIAEYLPLRQQAGEAAEAAAGRKSPPRTVKMPAAAGCGIC